MEQYKVAISPTAQNDFLDITEHMSNSDPEEAARYYELFMEKVELLKTMPEVCPLAKDAQLRLRAYRMLSVENYIIFFVVNVNTVEIRRILYAKRQYERLV